MVRTGERQRSRLVRAPAVAHPVRHWDGEAAQLLDGLPAPRAAWAPVSVLGGPGTGKTSLLVDLAVRRLRTPGVDPESVLVLTASRRAARDIRVQVTAGLAAAGVGGAGAHTVREPLVRTVHSYAFAVLRLQSAAHDNPPPRLITGAEQDAVIRELLRGEIADGAPGWPDSLRPALGMTGFARELRDLLLRAAERGLAPEDLVKLGRTHKRKEWVAAGRFGLLYEQVLLLRSSVGMEAPQASAPAVDAAGLVSGALDAFAGDPELLADQRARVRHLLVDDAQHLDPHAAELVRQLGAGAREVVVAGDTDQAIYGFRGADPTFLADLPARHRVLLTTSHRCAPAVADVVARISSRLPGAAPQRGPAARTDGPAGRVQVRLLRTVAQEAAHVADTLRRAHLMDGVPYAEMAVIVRSTTRALPALRRALLSAGVPVQVPTTDLPLARQQAAQGLLLALTALTADDDSVTFDDEAALALLTSPFGGADPVSLRRLRRGLRRVELAAGGHRDSAELIRELLLAPSADSTARNRADDPLTALTAAEAEPLRRVQRVLAAARAVLTDGRGVEEVLWAAWQASALERRWVAAAARGGAAGAQADRDLDAVVALFDAAARYVDRLPAGSVAGFVEYLSEQELATGGTDALTAAGTTDAVTVLTAHSAAGRQWHTVAVSGVQEGLWPALRSKGSLLGTEQLVDIVAGTDPALFDTLSRTAPLLAEERRLFLVACSRAAHTLLVTAVNSAAGDTDLLASRFVDEVSGLDADSVDPDEPDPRAAPVGRALVLGELVADLRAVVCDPEADVERRDRAAAQLARLAAAGVRGAHPDSWYGLGETSTAAQLWQPGDGPVPVSPSTVDLLSTCPLRWLLERHGGQDGSATSAVTGTLVHALVQAIAEKASPDEVDAALERAWTAVDVGAPWYSRLELERTRGMLETFRQWWQRSRADLTEVAVEVDVDVLLRGRPGTGTESSPAEPEAPHEPEAAAEADQDAAELEVRVRGRIDRLERDALGRLVVVDVKTSKNPVTADAAAEHAQLATYQVAAAEGGVADVSPDAPSGGARLVYVAKAHAKQGATQRSQPALTDETRAQWRGRVIDAAAATQGPEFLAVVNDGCTHCPVNGSCPAQDSGRQVGGS
ncbi:ATP-dependent DNA helicase [Rhodococcus sp. X156]|uniref:ATP-dependent helicase n=1 Tax=Rhodococcus sp. X156 TaxID=2499145 RepID=UPI000FDC9864|nr:ATP-dependent DNA helicase [Rhodococcus sp. X156]